MIAASQGNFQSISQELSFTPTGIAKRYNLKYNTVKCWLQRLKSNDFLFGSKGHRPRLLDTLAVENVKDYMAQLGDNSTINQWKLSLHIRNNANDTRERRQRGRISRPIRAKKTVQSYKMLIQSS